MPTIELVQKLQENSDNLEQLARQSLAKWEESEGRAKKLWEENQRLLKELAEAKEIIFRLTKHFKQ